MPIKVLKRLGEMIQPYTNLSYEWAERRYRWGGMSGLHWRIYCLFWTWGAPRFGGPAAGVQERYAARHGMDALVRRINQFREAMDLPPYGSV
jgi:hypothetical protein